MFRTWVSEGVSRKEIALRTGLSLRQVCDALQFFKIYYDRATLKTQRRAYMVARRQDAEFEAARRTAHSGRVWSKEERQVQSAKITAAWRRPETRETITASIRNAFTDHEMRAAQAARAARASQASAEARRRRREMREQEEQRRLAAEQAEAELQARLATLAPFERTLELIRLGRVKVVERIPMVRPIMHTLGGVTSYD